MNYVPDIDSIIAASKLLDPGTVEIIKLKPLKSIPMYARSGTLENYARLSQCKVELEI